MKLFVFTTSNWDYCYGCCIVVSTSFGRATELLNKYIKEDDEDNPTHIFSEKPFEKEGSYQWALCCQYDVDDKKERIIEFNYNFA